MTVSLKHTVWGNANLRAKAMSEREALMWIAFKAGSSGSFTTSLRDLSEELRWHRNRTWRFLGRLEASGIIEADSGTLGTVITLLEHIENPTLQVKSGTLHNADHIENPADLRAWLETSTPGDACLYHIGFLSRDRRQFPGLNALAEGVGIMAEAETLALRADRIRLPTLAGWAYVAIRRSSRVKPAALIEGRIAPFEYRALQAVQNRDADISAERAIRNALSPIIGKGHEAQAKSMLNKLLAEGWIMHVEAKGYELTKGGRAALV